MSLQRISFALLCCAWVALSHAPVGNAAPQDQGPAAPTSLEKVKEGVETPIVTPLTPSVPVRLHPVFKSGVEKHPFVLTLDEDLHKTFDLTDLQRQSAAWSAQCCGIGLGGVFSAIKKSQLESQRRKAREQVLRELADLEAARAAAAIIK